MESEQAVVEQVVVSEMEPPTSDTRSRVRQADAPFIDRPRLST